MARVVTLFLNWSSFSSQLTIASRFATPNVLDSQLETCKFFDSQFACSQLTDSQPASWHFRITLELDWLYLHETQNVTRFINNWFLLGKKVYINKWNHLLFSFGFPMISVNRFLHFFIYFKGCYIHRWWFLQKNISHILLWLSVFTRTEKYVFGIKEQKSFWNLL